MIKRRLIFALLLLSVFSISFAQPGSLDASFAGKGLQTYSFKQNASSETPTATVTDASGNIYITGAETTTFTLPFIAKLLPGGKPDLTFGNGGKKILSDIDLNYTFYPKAMALHPDGSIILAGYLLDESSFGSSPCIVKLSSSGAVQNLGGKGTYKAYPGLETGSNSMFTGVHVLPNGDIIATGDGGSGADFVAAKMNPNGNPSIFTNFDSDVLDISTDVPADATCSFLKDSLVYVAGNTGTAIVVAAFNPVSGNMSNMFAGTNGGQETLPVSGNTTDNFCTSIQVNASNRVILGGYGSNNTTSNHDFLIYQLMPDGSFEFCKNYSLPNISESYSMALDASGKIVLGGFLQDSGKKNNWTILRTDASGKLDTGFGTGGYQTFTSLHGNSAGYGANCLLRLPDGSYLLTGLSSLTSDDVVVKKLTASGSPLAAFGTNSEYRLWLADLNSRIDDIVFRPDGQFYGLGNYANPNLSSNVPVLALFKSDGTLNTSFGGQNGADPGILDLSYLIPGNVSNQDTVTTLQLQADGKILIAGTYFGSGAYEYAFLIRLNADATLDGAFGSGKGYMEWNTESHIHHIVIQNDQKILAYGYDNRDITLRRYNADGSIDAGFGSGGYVIFSNTDNGFDRLAERKIEIALQPTDQKIIGIGTTFEFDSGNFLVFRLNTNGTPDNTFGSNTDGTVKFDFASSTDYATALCLKPDGKIVTGGYARADGIVSYAMLQLTAAGIPDTTFGTQHTGGAQFNKGYFGHSIAKLAIENSNAIVAAGLVQINFNDPTTITALRITSAGILDNTFNGKGHALIGQGYTRSAVLSKGSFYIAGANTMFSNSPVLAEVIKLKLGSGPVIKSTNLQLTDLQKTYGDAPFKLKPSTNSSAAVQYSIIHGTCATVDAATGLVTIKCVPSSPDEYVGIKAYQPPVTGFTEAEANITLSIAKAIPKIVFTPQGGLIDSTILLKAITKEASNGWQFNVLQDPDFVLQDLGGGNMTILREGCAIVEVTVYQTENYLQGTATTSVCGFVTPLPPLTYDDEVDVTYAVDFKTTINVLANDEGRSGTIDPSSVDLDPSTPDVADTVFISSAYGKFSVDALGNVTYMPFESFIGKGAITYTVRDSYGLVSDPATLTVTQTISGNNIPELKATELFTPNHDGLNDAFVIRVDLEKENKLKVFDRNGQELFTKINYRNDWYGELPNGKEAENGIYYYVFQEGASGDQRELKGVVELRR